MLGYQLATLLAAAASLAGVEATPTHKHGSCGHKKFWWPVKQTCLPYGGVKHPHPAPPRHHCGRWFYWDKKLGCCVPPQPEVINPECPPGWTWNEYETACVPAPVVVTPGQCSSSTWWWEPKACCLPAGGPPTPLPSPPLTYWWLATGGCALTIGTGATGE
ncbi:chitin binding peritrophin-A domain-containing protein [Rhizoctonia solani AG-1 IA]|uniref:Chitin binding peritrophin-A domain-containing protein n=1 Tax=Thanatephorus cucumeris (strain AG1-IA) TaxID=983506 RepID=L8X0Y9_THACA|nr:chitin binding peritrophin-A domain-containing protein [Rhizoctonia solani AG-1 IA]